MSDLFTLREIRGSAKKPENFWFRIFYFCSSYIVWVAVRMKVTPNQLTLVSFALNTLGLVYFLCSPLKSFSVLVALGIFTIAHTFDCADGHLAFIAHQRSERGYWLDSGLDIFKSAFITICFSRIVSTGGVIGTGNIATWARSAGLCSSMGVLVNYAVGLHAGRYRHRVDTYETQQIETIGIRALSNVAVRTVLTHVREYGNLLVTLGAFAVNATLGLCLLIGLGFCHYGLALYRVYRVASLLHSLETDSNPSGVDDRDTGVDCAQVPAYEPHEASYCHCGARKRE